VPENNDKYWSIEVKDPFDVTDADENADDAEDGGEGSDYIRAEIKLLVKNKGAAGVEEAIHWLIDEMGYSQEDAKEILRTMFPNAYHRWKEEYQDPMPEPGFM
jgi:hypothetical protein